VLDASFAGGPTRCWASLHDLATPEVDVWLGREVLTLELHRTGAAHDLAADGAELGQFEQALAGTTNMDERLLSLACLAIVYDRASVRFAARSKTALANALVARRRRALAEADRLAKRLVVPQPRVALTRIDQGAEGWMLVVVPSLEEQLFEHALVTLKGRPTTLLVALLAHPRTAPRALSAIEKLPKTTQLVLAMALFFPSYTGFRESLLGTRHKTELARISNALADLYATSPRDMQKGMRQAIRDARVDASWLTAWDELEAMDPTTWRDPPP
jgi:hypothetical protein